MVLSQNLIQINNSASSQNLFLTDDLCIDFSNVLGTFLAANPASAVSASLFFGGVDVTGFISQSDLAFGSDFTNGIINIVIENTVLDTLSRTNGYQLVLRIESGGLQTTLTTLTRINLLS